MDGPLEDSGGPPGYNELVAGFGEDPPFASLEDYVREWLPEGWDPTVFDLDQVNAAGLLRNKNPYLAAARGLFAILSVSGHHGPISVRSVWLWRHSGRTGSPSRANRPRRSAPGGRSAG